MGRTLLNKLESATVDESAPAPSQERQEAIDSSVQKKLREELRNLRRQEKEMQKQVELALEKEVLEKEHNSWFHKDKGQSRVLLQQEIDRVKSQAEKFKHRDLSMYPELKNARESVVQCYRYVRPQLTQRQQEPHPRLLEGARRFQEGDPRRAEGTWPRSRPGGHCVAVGTC